MESVEVRGLKIAFQRKGAGPALVLLHGAVSDSREWHRQIDSLSEDFTVVAWDAPGCGRSSDPPETFRLPDYADCLAGLIEKLELERPCVLGLSFGGGLAIEFFGRYPHVPRALVLASAYAGWAGSLPADEVQRRVEGGMRQSEMPAWQVVSEWIPTLFSQDTPLEVVAETAAIMSDFHPAGVRVMLQAFAEADLREVLPRIDVPTLLVYGQKDKRAPLPVAEELHAAIPGSRLVIFPDVGHMTHVEAPQRFESEVRAFLTSAG